MIHCNNNNSYYFFSSLLVNFDDDMVEQFSDEDDFIIKFEFDNQTGHVHLYVIPTAYV